MTELLREVFEDALTGGLDLEGYKERLTDDAERIAEFVAVAVKDVNMGDGLLYEQEFLAVVSAWIARAFEIARDPARVITTSGKNPFDGERKLAKAFIEKYDLQVSFRDALKHW